MCGILCSISVANAQDFDNEILKASFIREVNSNKFISTDSLTIKINNRDGEDLAQIQIPYSKGDKVSIGDAWIEDESGNIIRKLKGKDVSDRNYISNISLYEDSYIKEFDLKHNQYPYIIKYSYKITHPRFIQIASFDFIDQQIPIKSGSISVQTETGTPIKIKQKNLSEPEIANTDKGKIYTWTFEFDPKKKEKFADINNSNAPKLQIVPETFTYGIPGSFENWQTFGNWIYRLNSGRDILPDSEKQKIDNLLEGSQTQYEKIKKLYHYLQDYNRYINVVLKIGGLQTYPAEYVAKNHYGDCKALSNYMMSMLKYAGIESFYTLINTEDKIEDIDPDFASQAFNHVIVTVPMSQDTIYMECTSKSNPLGYVHSSIQGRKALLVSENDSHLIDIPATKIEDAATSIFFDINFNANSLSTISSKIKVQGSAFESLNYISNNENKNYLEKYIRKYYIPNNIEQTTFSLKEQSRDSTNTEISISGISHSIIKEFGNNISIKPFPFNIPTVETTDKRKRNIQIDYPINESMSFTYKIDNKNISKIPEGIIIINKYGSYLLNFALSDNQLKVNKSFILNTGRYNLDEYPDFFEFLKKVRNIETKNYYIETL